MDTTDFAIAALHDDIVATDNHVSMLKVSEVFNDYAQHASQHYGPVEQYIAALERARAHLCEGNEQNALLRNTLQWLLPVQIRQIDTTTRVAAFVKGRHHEVLTHMNTVNKTVTELGWQKIKRGMRVFLYGYDPRAIDILVEAKQRGIAFEVFVSAAGTGHAGKKVATELRRAAISVIFIPDSHIRWAIKQSDIAFVSIESVDKQLKAYGHMGTEMVCELAHLHHTAIYICMDSWQYDPSRSQIPDGDSIQKLDSALWPNAPDGIKFADLRYEKVDASLVRAIISEQGIHAPADSIKAAISAFPELF